LIRQARILKWFNLWVWKATCPIGKLVWKQVVDPQQLAAWNELSGLKVKLKAGLTTRREVLG
jgi:hypothetical protein